MADNTNTVSSTDTSSVTAIKVKVVLDTTTEELKNQFKGVQNSFKKAPVEIAFGVDEGATIGNINATLKRIIKKVESPKLTLEIDESNIDAAVKKAVNKAQSGAKNAKAEVKVNLNTNEAKQKLDAFYRRVQEKGSLYKDALKLESSGKNQLELEEVLRQLQNVRNEAGRLRAELVNILPTEEFSKISEIERATTNSISRLEARLQGLKNAANNDALKALKKSQSDQTNTYSNNLADANNKYKKFSGASDVKSSLADVQKQIDILNTLETGTQDYADQLKVVADTWTDATRQMSAFDEAQKKTENHVKSMTEQALKWKESIKDSDTASQELRDSIDGIIDSSKKLDSDHSSDAYKKGVKDLDDAFIGAKASMSVYTDGYKDLESTARRTLTEIRKKELELEQAGNHNFDSILIGDSKTTSLDNSLESQLNSLKGMNIQSATYKQRVSEIVEEWLKVKIQIEQALKSEEDLAKEAAQRHNQVRSKQGAYNTIQNRLNGTEFTKVNSAALSHFNTDKLNDSKTGEQVLADLDAAMKKLDENQGPTEFKATLSQVDDLLVQVRKHIDDALSQSRQTKTANTDIDKMENLMRTLYQYKETLHGFEGSKYEQQYNELFDAIKNGSYSFEEAQMRVSKFQNACHQAGLETETLGQKLSRLFKEHFQTAIAMAGVAMVKQGLREVYDNVVEIDDAMVELRKVTNESENAYSQFSDRAAKTARDLGASISDYISATADWSRLGYNMPDAEELARVSTLLKNVGDGIESVTDASSYMTSVLKGFDLVAEDAQKVADLVNEVANNEPASAEDILEILTRSGAALHEAGNDLDQAVALGVAMNSVTQNAESTGQTLKTVSMYLRAAKTDLTAMGESTDGCANSVSELRSELKKLTGVDIMADAAGTQFKSTYDILMEISKVWGKLTDVDRANVTELLGGKRNANSVSAVLSQFQIAEKSMKDAANSAGSAAKENEVYLTSITGKLNQLDSAFQQFSKDLLDSSLIKFFVDFATATVDIADGAVKAAGALPTLTAAISGVLSVMQMSGKLKNGAGKVNMPSYICCV